jgi:hypothetical protein
MRLTIATLARLHDTKPPDPATVNTIVQKLRQEAPKHTHHH